MNYGCFRLSLVISHFFISLPIWGQSAAKNGHCAQIRMIDLKRENASEQKNLYESISLIVESIDKNQPKILANQFHQRLKIDNFHSAQLLTKIRLSAGAKPETSIYKIWFVDQEREKIDYLDCGEATFIKPLFGYKRQAAVWIQVTGDADIMRVFMNLVYTEKKWLIGSLHAQKWTHLGEDSLAWFEKAKNEHKKSNPMRAYAYAHLASKLLYGSGYYLVAYMNTIKFFQQSVMSPARFLSQVSKSLPNNKAVYANPIFSAQGVGLLIRFRVQKELSLKDSQEFCLKVHSQLKEEIWYKNGFDGLRCGLVLPKENPNFEGVLGSLWLQKAKT